MQRLVQAPKLGGLNEILLRGILRQQHIHRIAGNAGQGKDDDAHGKQGQESMKQADNDITLHCSSYPFSGPCRSKVA